MKKTLNRSFAAGGIVLIMMSGCVSSKKYHASQNSLAQARNDSAQLAQQVASLNSNVQDLQNKNTALQQNLDKTNGDYANTQKSLGYYQGYFKDQQAGMSQVSDDVKGALTQAGVANADVEQRDNVVYVTLDESDLFRKNSVAVTPGGKKVLDGLAQAIVTKSNVNVFVASGDSVDANGTVAMSGSMGSVDDNAAPVHHPHHKTMHTSSSSSSSSNGAVASSSNTGSTNNMPAHKKVHHKYSSEGGMAYNNGMGRMHHSWALKQGRMMVVSNHFLKNGLPKVNLTMQRPPMGGNPQNTMIKVIIRPSMKDFNPQGMSSTSVGTVQSDAASR